MESPGPVDADAGLYLYCFFAGSLAVVPPQGIEAASRPFVLPYRDLGALVSRVPLHDYSEPTLQRRQHDLAWLTARVTRHDQLVRAVRERHPVIPVTFGTLYLSAARVLAVLQHHYRAFRAFLTFIQDKEEWGVNVFVGGAPDRALPEASTLTRALDHRLATATPGEAYLLRKQRTSP